jgi:hypothetical protein
LAEPALQAAKVRQQGAEVQVTASLKTDAAALGNAVVEATESINASANRARSMNNLRQLAIAMHGYNDVYKRLPPAVVASKDGKPLYSWRVALLPFIEGDKLYQEFNLEEPWDSEHNKTLLAKMPKVYAPVGVKTKEPYTTFYQVFYGKGAAFQSDEATIIPASFTDGTAYTILIAEAAEPVPWTKPADLPFGPDKPLPKVGGLFKDFFTVAMTDGSSRAIPKTVKEKTLRALITRNGGEHIEDF